MQVVKRVSLLLKLTHTSTGTVRIPTATVVCACVCMCAYSKFCVPVYSKIDMNCGNSFSRVWPGETVGYHQGIPYRIWF